MTTLTEFLLARIEEDEAAAQVRTISRRMINGVMTDVPIMARRGAWAWSPARVLAECEAKRQLIDEITGDAHRIHGEWGVGPMDYDPSGLCIMAAVYADHPDFDEAWRPDAG
jgi:hypothetical protein